MSFLWVLGVGDGEVSVEDLVQESRVGESRWVRDGESRGGGFDEVRVEVFGLVSVFEGQVLEEGVCGEWGFEEVLGEERRRVREDCGLGLRKEERGLLVGVMW